MSETQHRNSFPLSSHCRGIDGLFCVHLVWLPQIHFWFDHVFLYGAIFSDNMFHYVENIGGPQERPYQHDSTASSLLSEVKHVRARLVLRWGTTLESRVLFFL